jgi:hypothetical protein
MVVQNREGWSNSNSQTQKFGSHVFIPAKEFSLISEAKTAQDNLIQIQPSTLPMKFSLFFTLNFHLFLYYTIHTIFTFSLYFFIYFLYTFLTYQIQLTTITFLILKSSTKYTIICDKYDTSVKYVVHKVRIQWLHPKKSYNQYNEESFCEQWQIPWYNNIIISSYQMKQKTSTSIKAKQNGIRLYTKKWMIQLRNSN